MKRVRIWIRAEYELPDEAEVIEVTGEHAIKFGNHTVKPSLEFFELQEADEKSSNWTEVGEPLYDSLVAAETSFVIDVVHSDSAT